MTQSVLVLIKPDGINKLLVGEVFSKLAHPDLALVALRVIQPTRELVEEHYQHLKDETYFDKMVDFLQGKFHENKNLIAAVYCGDNAVERCREIAGDTDPREAKPDTIRGAFGCITDKGIYENVVHVSSDEKEAEREVKLWFNPDEIICELYPTKLKDVPEYKERVWA